MSFLHMWSVLNDVTIFFIWPGYCLVLKKSQNMFSGARDANIHHLSPTIIYWEGLNDEPLENDPLHSRRVCNRIKCGCSFHYLFLFDDHVYKTDGLPLVREVFVSRFQVHNRRINEQTIRQLRPFEKRFVARREHVTTCLNSITGSKYNWHRRTSTETIIFEF